MKLQLFYIAEIDNIILLNLYPKPMNQSYILLLIECEQIAIM